MFNQKTESLIRHIPQISGVNETRLPQWLSRVYARIICLKTKYEDGALPFNNAELNNDHRELESIVVMLELYLMDKYNHGNRRSIAFVAATARKLMSLIRNRQSAYISLYSIPEDLYASLLYVISGSLADAQEVADHFRMDADSKWGNNLLLSVRYLLSGKLRNVLSLKEPTLENMNPELFAEELIWREMIRGLKHLAVHLLDGSEYYQEEFLKVEELSCSHIDLEGRSKTDIFTGALLLSRLLIMAAEELKAHGLIQVAAPEGVSSSDWHSAMRRQIEFRPYLWDNHLEAIGKGVLNNGTSAVITFPTGAGKTTLSELKIVSCLLTGRAVIYLVPTHALERQVYKNIRRLVERIAEPTIINRDGEFALIEDGSDQSIQVMTPERCLTILTVKPEQFWNVGLVVFDEFQLMSGDEKDNRAVDSMLLMTELLTLLPKADFLLISAMVSNGAEVAQWIQKNTERNCLLLDNPWKPTSQLQGCVVYNLSRIRELNQTIRERQRSGRTSTPPKDLRDRMLVQPECLFSLKTIWDTENVDEYYNGEILDHQILLAVGNSPQGKWYLSANYNKVAAEIAEKYAAIGLKTIIFALDPKSANSINKTLTGLINEDRSDSLSKKCKKELDLIAMELGGFNYSFLADCLSATLHHSNMLPEERDVSERYFTDTEGVSVMVATPTISQGINLPADIVLIAGSARYDKDDQKMEQIDAHEILNAAGRAGRAGFRSHGTAILIPSKPIGMENNSIQSIWTDIKDEIFSKGDRCLEIEDPLEKMMKLIEQGNVPPLLYKIHGEENRLRESMSHSFYAYKMQIEGKQDKLDRQVAILAKIVSNKVSDPDVSMLAVKTRTSEEIVKILLYEMIGRDFMQVRGMSVRDLIKWVSSLLSDHYELMDALLNNTYVSDNARKVVGMKEIQLWSKEYVEILFSMVDAYVSGAALLDMEKIVSDKVEAHLDKARLFVLKVLPAISYICGAIIQILLTLMGKEGIAPEDCSNDMKTFALCVKEGMPSYDMLMKKYKHRMMRVECHKYFGK